LKISASITIAAAICAALWAADALNVKPGQWQATITTEMSGLPPIPPEVLEKMTPQQRQMMEQRMKGNQPPRTITAKSCITKEDIQKGFDVGNQEGCTRTVISSSSNKQEVKVECNRDDAKMTGTFKIEASGPESVKGEGQMTVTSGGHTMNSKSSFDSKWISPTCEKDTK
jgi:hypothetical protein